jgi:hypothetical protein
MTTAIQDTEYSFSKSLESKSTTTIMALIKKNVLFILVIISTVFLEIIEWLVVTRKFIPIKDSGEYDFLGNYRMVFGFLKFLFLFTNLSFLILLAIFLLYRDMIDTNLKRNIYYSCAYLILSLSLIEYFF